MTYTRSSPEFPARFNCASTDKIEYGYDGLNQRVW